MHFRALLTFVNLAVFVAAIVVLEAFPAYGDYALYGFIAWMVASLALFYSPWARARATASRGPAPGVTVSADAPLPSGGASAPSAPLGFCIYCAAPIEPSAARCPSCGHALPHLG
jgi:hypothetical protein